MVITLGPRDHAQTRLHRTLYCQQYNVQARRKLFLVGQAGRGCNQLNTHSIDKPIFYFLNMSSNMKKTVILCK